MNFQKKKTKVASFADGNDIPLAEVNDDGFSSLIMSNGLAIRPTDNIIVAPFNAKTVFIADTKHAMGLETNNGIEAIIHIGIDTVLLNGKGFTVHYSVNDIVKAGELIASFDDSYLTDNYIDMMTMLVFTNIKNPILTKNYIL